MQHIYLLLVNCLSNRQTAVTESSTTRQGENVKARAERRYWTERNWHGLVFDELTNGQAGRANWALADAHVSVVP